jgi:hypothetical protein
MKLLSALTVLFFWFLEALWIDWVVFNTYNVNYNALVYLIPLAIWSLFIGFLRKVDFSEILTTSIALVPFSVMIALTLKIWIS